MKKSRNKKGFTIPEMLVAIFVFSVIVGAAANLLLFGIVGQRSSLAQQELLDQTSFVAEYMSRALRQASKDLTGTCLSAAGLNYEVTQARRGVKFLNVQGQCQEFFLESGRIKERLPAEAFLTSDNLSVTSLRFVLRGKGQDDDVQPRVTFNFVIKGQGAKAESRPQLQFQTSVSQRKVDVPE